MKALEMDDTLPEAHNSLGLILALYDFDFAQSKKEFERAIELNPNYATAHHQFGNMNLSMIGEFDRAIASGARDDLDGGLRRGGDRHHRHVEHDDHVHP